MESLSIDGDKRCSLEEAKWIVSEFIRRGYEPEFTIIFEDMPDEEYMIIGYEDRVTFQRCRSDRDGSDEIPYRNLEELFSSDLIDGWNLNRDWDRVKLVYCRPNIDRLLEWAKNNK
ncbi:hypothetical protein [Selenomonas sp.]|uniref:hypothetical protein n=1 Tax=Selenomonas sp. TaxID=2053611 RepID=UPI003A0FD6C4